MTNHSHINVKSSTPSKATSIKQEEENKKNLVLKIKYIRLRKINLGHIAMYMLTKQLFFHTTKSDIETGRNTAVL